MNEKERQRRNQDLVKRLKDGESLLGSSASTWFPPRPIIEKDKETIERLFGDAKKEKSKKILKPV